MAMSRPWKRAVGWAAVAALGAGLVSSVVSAQPPRATVTAYGFELSCDASVSEGSTLACTLSNTSDEVADWPTVGIVHLSSDDDRALVVGSPVDVAFGALEGGPETEDDVWWIGDVLVGYSRFDWDGQATASSGSETTDSRTVNIVVADDTAWEEAESFYVALAPSGARGVGFLHDHRQKVTIQRSDFKSGDATLASLVISAGGTTTDLTPPPISHPLTAEYTTTELTVAPTATYKPSGISVAVDSGAAYSFAAQSGDETRAIPLAVGVNTISVTVTAEDGASSQAYKVVVDRVSLVDGATVTASSDGFSLTCPGTVAEGSTMECTLTSLSTSPADWPVVAFLHSSADGSRALIAGDPIIPESSLLYSQDIRLKDPQVPAVDNYNYGYGELFSGGSRSVYATYGYEKFDWFGPAEASTSRIVFVEVLADGLDEGNEIFYAAIADSGYTGLSDLVDNKVPIVVRGTSSAVPVEAIGKHEAADVFWTGLDAIDGEPVTSYDLRYIRSDATDRSDGSWEVRTSIWTPGDGVLAFELSGLVNDVSYDIQLRAVAGTTTGPWSTTQTVTPRPSNEAPAFPDTETGQRSVVEGAIAGRSVGAPISATDREGDTLLYSLQSGGDVFDIRAATGQLSTKAELDYETAATHSVVIAVSDGKDLDHESDPAVDATVEVTVSVIDVNEPPAFPDTETGQRSVVEGAIAGRSVGAPISATDPEGDTLLYSLQSGGDVFDIRAATGQLSTKAELDYETAATHSVVIAVSDGKDLDHESDPAVDATVEVTVAVIDVNEPPAFPDTETGQRSVVEGAIAGRSVGAPISATDPEGDTRVYSLQSGGDVFDIRAATGQLLTKAELDYETAATHSVVIAVSDGKDLDGEPDPAVDATVDVTVSVTDVNEPPALSGPSAVEFVEGGDDSVGAYAAVDPDGDEVSWSVGGADAASFEISAEGVLRFLSPPDFEARGDADGDNAYQVQVRVTDGKDTAGEPDAAVDATVEVTVSVTDVNEPPALSGPSAVEFVEGGDDSVGAYAAVDPDGDEVSWSVGGADAASFEISAEGVLRFLSPPDFEAPGDADGDNAYQVQVRVTDGKDTAGEPDAAVDATVEMTVSVTDVAEWSVTAVPARVAEGAVSTVTVSVDKEFEADQTITLAAVGGTAASGDYSLSSLSLTLVAGDMSVTASVTAVDDSVIDGGDETVVVTASHGGGAVGSATVTIGDNDTAVWSVVAVPARVVEGAVSTVTVSVGKEFSVDQTITLTVGGTAASGDYSLSSLSLTLVAGDMSVTASVTAVDDSVIDGGDETVVVTASHGDETVGSATVTIGDNDTAVWSVVAVPARVAEGAVSTVTVSVDKEFEVDQTITLAATGGTAASGDYSLSSLSLTLGAGDMSVTASVTAVDDSVIDGGDETVVVTASHGDETVGSATVTIEDNDTAVWSVAAGPARVVEGAVSTVTVSVDKEFEVDQTITLAATGTAASGDYSLSSSSLTLDAGDTSVTASVTAVDDSDEESDETVVVTASHGDETVGSATVTIEDNDTPVWSVVAVPARVAEGAVSTVTVSVDKAFEADQTITLTVGGTAASGDYSLSPSLSLTLVAGDMSVTASVTAVDDSVIDGGDETVVVTASHGGGAVGSATVTIGDNDTAVWSVVAVPARVAEGAVSTVTVSVGKAFSVDQTITLAATGGTAASGDYSLSSLSLTLVAGDMSVTASVTAVDDSVIDGGDETVVVTASHGGGAVGSATVTIGDNDTAVWSVVAVPARVVEGAVSTVTVSVGKEFSVDQTITLTATGGTAASGDYSLSSLSLTLVAGDMSVTASVTAVDDSVIDGGDETVVVTASHGGGAVGSATVTIGDNDTAVWSVVAVPARVVEGAVSTVTVSVGKEFSVDQTITLAATGGTAASGDYSLSSLSLTLVAGDMSVTASVTAVDDSVIDGGDETVVVTASHGGGAVGSATVTIGDNDTAVWSVVAVPARVVEGAVSTVTVSVGKAFEVDQTITLAATGGTAASGDYSLSSLSLTLVAGDMSVTASVTAVDDSVIDGGDETVVVTASHGGGAVGSATVTIGDNDTAVWSVVAGPARVVEGAVSTVTVSVDKAFEADQTITLAVGGTAASGDYSLSSLSLTLVAGDMSVTASVTAVDDSVIDGGDETVVVTASHGGGAVGSATVTIEDNDTPTWSVVAVPARVVEGAASTVTVSVDKEFSVDQTITLTVGGTAASGDYSLSSLSLTLVAGDMSVTASVTAVDDSVIDGGDETVVVTASHGGGAVGSATVTIGDNDTAVWSVVAVPARVVEGAALTVTVSVGNAFEADQTITLAATGGTAASGDYSLSPLSLTLDAGDTSVTATVTAVDDSVEESDETVVVTASHGDETVGSATVTIEANDMPVSTDAALSSLVLSGVSIGNFDADTTAYAASVGNGVSSTTVTAVASDDGASVVIADGDGETQGTSRSVSLVVGDNEITVTVTAEDAATTKTYTITVARAVAPLPPGVVWGDRLPDRDIALPGASSSSGVWSDGTDVWVVTGAGKISVYSLADGAEHTDRGFTLPGGAAYAAGLWSDGATLWVADVNSGWVRAYRLSDGARQADRDLDTARNGEPAGIWSDGTTMWVADFTDSRVHAYDLTTKARVADKELDLDKNPGETYNPFGIWSNGDTLLAASWFGSEIIAHSLADGQRQPAKDLSTFASRTNSPNGIWSNGHILWVVDASAATLYAYAVPGLGTPPNDTAVWSVVAVPARVAEGAVSTVTVSVDKEFEADQTITLAAVGGTAASGDYSLSPLSLTLVAGDMSVTASVTAVDDSVIDGGDETVVVTASHGGGAVGSATVTIGDNDTAVWSVVAVPARVVEGAVSTVTVSVGKEFSVDQTITLTATGGTAASGDYSLSSLSLTLVAGDMSVTASVTAVDDSVIDGGDETVVVTASHGGGAVGSATVTIEDNDTPTWSVAAVPARVVEGAVSTVTVSVGKAFEVDQTITLAATGTAASGDYSLSPTSSLTLVAGDVSVTASVTAVDDSVIDGGDETVVVTASHGDETVGSATVTIEDNDTPTWSVVAGPARVVEGAVSTVTVSVDKEFEVDQTITLAATGGTAASGDYSLSPLSLTLDAGDTSVTATVTAVDDSDEESDETVVVTASHGDETVGSATVTIEDNDTPTWSVVAVPARVAEGAVSTVTVSVGKAFEADQTITLAATGGTAASADYSLSPLSLTLVAGDMSVTASVTAVDDSVIDGGDETVVVTASHGGGAVGSATVTIEDNDTAVWSVVAVPARVVEGAVSTVTVSVDKAFSVDQTITLAVGGTAASGDYSLSSLSLTLVAGDMSVTASVTAVDDSVIDGGDETVVVTASHGGGAVGSATVTIEDNDTPTWSVVAVPARVVEGAASTVTVSVDKEFSVDQTITLTVGGTAASGDYSLSSLSLTLVAGDMSVTASVTAVDDSVIDGGDETVVVTASHGGGAVGSATVTIGDNDTAVWSVVAVPARVVEGAALTVTVSVGNAFEADQTITLAATGGTAASGDYSLSPLSLTLDAGDTSVTATVTAVDDSVEESDETVVVTASHGDETVGSATVTIEANDMPVSTDAALSSLVLSGVSIGNFDADTTAYAASVGNGVSSTTVTAVASDDGASVVIADGDGETQGTSRSVSLVVGDNEITVTVTAEDAATTKTYTITVARAVAPLPPGVVWGDRLPDRDIALPGASSSSGVWSDGTDVWVVTGAGKISVYSLADGAEHTDRGFTLPGGAAYAAGLWSDGATLWVADVNSGWVRAYRLSDGARQADRDLDTARNGEPAGIWSDGTTMWVADFTDSRVHAYDLTTKARVADKELDLDKNPGETYNPFGIWSNGDTLLAASWFGSEIIAHSLADGQRQPAKDLSTFASRTNSPNGIWSNGHILWVVDASAATLYAYAVPGLGTPPNDTAVWSVVAVPARVAEGAVSTVTVSVDKEFEADQTITLAAVGGTAASGDYSLSPLSLTLVAGDMSVTASVTAVDDSVIDGGDETVVVTASHGGGAVGSATVTIEDNDTPTWSVVAGPARVAEGAVSTVTVSVGKAFEADQTITLAVGGTAASGDYSLSPLSLTLGAGDVSVTASVTAVDDSVIDGGDETVVVTASHGGGAVGSATVTIEDNDTPTWSVAAVPARVVEGAVSTVTVSVGKAFEVDQTITLAATGTAASGDYSLSPTSSLTLVAGDVSVTASVTAVDDSVIDGGDETVVVTASHGDETVGSATVTIEDNDTPTWSVVAGPARVVEGAVSTVTVSVDKEFEVDQTITLAATGGTAASGDYSLSPLSLTLDAGDTSVTATVTAVDDSDEESDETVVVTASHGDETVGSATVTIEDNDTPTWSVVAVPARVAEGAVSTVTVSVDKAFEADQTITLTVGGTAASGDYSLSPLSLTLVAGDMSVTASVTAVDDSVIDGGDETVVVTASHGGGAVGSATVTIEDNDTAVWSVVAVPARVVEGAVSTVTVSVDKAFSVDQTITLTVGGTAASGDYSLSSLSLTLVAGDMSVTASVTAVDDSVIDGGDETVVVTASHGGGAVGSATVTIEDNDTPTWSVAAVPARVVEGAASTVTVSVDKAFEVDQTITLAATGGTAASGDYSLSSLSLTLVAGDMSVTASVTAVDDSVIDGGDETVVVTASHGGGAVGSATVTIGDNDTAVWSVVAVPARVVEGAALTVTVSVGNAFEADQTITLAATGGTAASGDYSLSPLSLTLDAGDTSVTATVTAVDDSDEESDETVVVTASHGDETVGSATVTIEANDTPTWSVVAVPARVVEGAVSTVTVSVDKEFEVDQTITLAATGGTAASGDYSLSSLSLTLVAGDMSVTASVTAVDDSVIDGGDETVVVTASHGGGAVGSATVTIGDNDTAVWSVVAGPARVVEGAVSTVTVSVDKAFEADQTITLAATGTAASGDYSLSSLSLTLVAGDMSVTASVTAVDDSVIDGGDETVVVTASHGGGAVGSATVTIGDNDTAVWSVAAVPARVVEGAASTVTVSVDKEFEADQTITLAATGGTAASGDYSLSSLSLTLDAGDTSVTASVTAVDDSVIDGGDETVVVTASHGGGAVGSATVTIEDNDTAVWSVVAVPARVVEGAASTVTVSVDKEFSVDQTITLAATGALRRARIIRCRRCR